jgi:hypothetical protein
MIGKIYLSSDHIDTLDTFETIYQKALWHTSNLQAKLKYFDYQIFQYESRIFGLEK